MKTLSALLLIVSVILLGGCDAVAPEYETQARHGEAAHVLGYSDERPPNQEMHPIMLHVSGGGFPDGVYVAGATVSYTTANGPVEHNVRLPWTQTVWLRAGALVQLSAHVPTPRGSLMASIFQVDTGHYVTRTVPNGKQVSVSTVVQSK